MTDVLIRRHRDILGEIKKAEIGVTAASQGTPKIQSRHQKLGRGKEEF